MTRAQNLSRVGTPARRRAWRRRGAERGAALFIVVLVIMALTGVAMFAAKSASTDVEIAGRYRQTMQTHQIARLGMQTAFSELTRDPETYIHAMSDPTVFGAVTCANQVTQLYAVGGSQGAGSFGGAAIDTGGCFAFHYDGVEQAMAAGTPGVVLVNAGDASTSTPSGLGVTTVRPDFIVEMTDKDTWDQPVMGFAAGSGVNMKFYTVTMSGRGMVVPRCSGPDVAATTPACTQAADTSLGPLTPIPQLVSRASVEDVRAQVMVGPLPAGL